METGMYLNALICLLIFIFSLNASFSIYRSNKSDYANISYAAFWFFVSLTWLAVAFALLAYKNGFAHFDAFVNQYIVQTLVFAQITAGIYYVFYRLTGKKTIAVIMFVVFVVISLFGLKYDYQPGSFYLSMHSYCSTEYHISNTAAIFFQIEFAIVMLGMIIDLLKNIFFWCQRTNRFERKYFFASLAALIYGLAGYFDNLGFSADWNTVFLRLAMVFCAHLAYLGYSDKIVN